MENCQHDFAKTKLLSRPIQNEWEQETRNPDVMRMDLIGVLLVCLYCGQRRAVWEDGLVEVLTKQGEVRSHGEGR